MFGKKCCQDRQMGFGMNSMDSCCMEQPIIEPTINKCIEREFYHEVPHVCPIHTHTINKHIYKHTYTPQYTCSEEEQVCNMDCGKCSGF
ncbi:MAG: hypothetical protein E7157_01255 [Lactobacillales bacterium]|nr:hypothetical protein [Lactobacillales bacterium]